MKTFLYLNTDLVNSIFSQENKGLIQLLSKEDVSNDINSKSDNSDAEISGSTTIGIRTLSSLNLGIGVHSSNGIENTLINESHELTQKVLHDFAYDTIYSSLTQLFVKEPKDIKIGSYVDLEKEFETVDLEFIENLISKDGFIDLIKKQNRLKIENEFDNLTNREQKRNLKKNEFINEKVKELNKPFENAKDIVSVMKILIPYKRLLVSQDGYFVPLEDQYFRVNRTNFGFMYSGKIHCVGLVTNIISDRNNNEKKNTLSNLHHMVNASFKGLLSIVSDIVVIQPIALYYESD